MIELDFLLPLASFNLEVRTSLSSPITAILGPSGSGKTSLLETIAGLRRNATGVIRMDGETLVDSSCGLVLRPEQRSVGYVPQDSSLFPHMTALQNLLFSRRRSRDGVSVDRVAAALEIEPLLEQYPLSLSGGERQRVALGRAILSSPRLLLLDEPLAALDQPLRERILTYLRRVRELVPIPMIYVTHQPMEALALSDQCLLLERGKVVAQGVPEDLLTRPELLGRSAPDNVLLVDRPKHFPARGFTEVSTESGLSLFLPHDQVATIRFPVVVQISSEEIMAFREKPVGVSARNLLEGTVASLEIHEGMADFSVSTPTPLRVRITLDAAEELGLGIGVRVWLALRTRAFRIVG